jgi:hypothetical protein
LLCFLLQKQDYEIELCGFFLLGQGKKQELWQPRRGGTRCIFSAVEVLSDVGWGVSFPKLRGAAGVSMA